MRVERGAKLCIFVTVARDGFLLPHGVDHARAWHDAGYAVVTVVVTEDLDAAIDLTPLAFARGVLVRANRGYDFGAWATVIRRLGRARRGLAMLALANDSVLGPSSAFPAMLARAEAADADLIGLTASGQFRHHLQSYALFFKPRALRSTVFRRFWHGVRSGDRDYVIEQYETALLARFEQAGLRATALFQPASEDGNPTLTGWRALLALGFPYIKIQLLRDNPAGAELSDWRDEASRHGFAPERLDGQIAALKRHGAASWRV